MGAFAGTQKTSLDERGRLRLSTRFVSAIGEDLLAKGLYLFHGENGLLQLWPVEQFHAFVQAFEESLAENEEGAEIIRGIWADSPLLETDRLARMVLPPEHLEDAGLLGLETILVAGHKQYLELWNPHHYRTFQEDNRRKREKILVKSRRMRDRVPVPGASRERIAQKPSESPVPAGRTGAKSNMEGAGWG